MKKETVIIGEYYYPMDNSYSRSLDTGKSPNCNNGAALAGDINTPPVRVKVLTNPFTSIIKNTVDQEKYYEFVIVEYEGRAYSVLNLLSDTPKPIRFRF